jgi:hypothetical protein
MNRPVLYWPRSSKYSTAADNGWSTKLTDSVFAKLLEEDADHEPQTDPSAGSGKH